MDGWMLYSLALTGTLLLFNLSEGVNQCVQYKFPSDDTFMCVCNSTYCDTVENYAPLKKGFFTVYTTSNTTGDRLTMREFQVTQSSNATKFSVTITIDKTTKYQSVIGFGGASTDSTAMNAFNLSVGARKNLVRSYFSEDGLEYSVSRMPIGCSDFSPRYYTFDDHPGDFNLSHFSLQTEDLQYKIPFMQESMAASRRGIKYYGSPWTPPIWMKTNQNFHGAGQIIGQPGDKKYYRTWANYFVRFLEEYRKHNITFWGITVENEPMAGDIGHYHLPSCYFTPQMERDFVKLDLGPTLHANGFQELKVMMMDDQRFELPGWPDVVLTDPEAAAYISGIGIHWYWDEDAPVLKLDLTHMYFQDYFMLYTEACYGKGAKLSLWERGEGYSHSIINNMNHWVSGWVDWNMVLNQDGGPSFVNNFLYAPIMIDAEKDVFYKHPTYYHLGHFSKFILPDSHRIAHKVDQETNLETIAFQLPDGHTNAVILLNKNITGVNISISDPDVGYINAYIPPRSIQTYLWTDK